MKRVFRIANVDTRATALLAEKDAEIERLRTITPTEGGTDDE